MSQTLKNILIIVLLILGAMWIFTLYRSCEAKKNADNTELSSNNETNSNDDSSEEEGMDELYVKEGEEEPNGDDEIFEEEGGEDDTSEDETTEDDSASDNGSTGTGVVDGDGEYLVVAGAFVAESNAKKMNRELTAKGIDSEIRIFLGSDYHSVIVGNYETESAAQSIVDQIGGEAYVHKKRYPKKRN